MLQQGNRHRKCLDHPCRMIILKQAAGESIHMKLVVLTMALMGCWAIAVSQDIEYCNNFLMNYSFLTGTNLGIEQNLEDNLTWMNDQGYTHLRFFGIYPNGVHIFPSSTLDSNGYPNSSYHEGVLEQLVIKAEQHDITVNFDGWEVIAESNYDTTDLGVGFITPDELALIVQDVLDLGVTLITEEQFGGIYLQAMQSATAAAGATHETTACLWYQYGPGSIADAQLTSVFGFFPRDQAEADSMIAAGHGYNIPTNLGFLHIFTESPRYFNIPTSVAVGSFGTFDPENWKNALLFTQVQHHPDRFSIEEQDQSFLISDPSFNFMEYVGNELAALGEEATGERPIVNLIYDPRWLYSQSFIPTWFTSQVNAPAIVNTFSQAGFKVVATVDSVLPEADMYYLLLTGGFDESNVAPLPDYVMPLLDSDAPVFVHPASGIPDDNDAGDWIPLREHFGLPPGETQTLANAIPETVIFNGFQTKWRGIKLYITPSIELLPILQIDTSAATVVLSEEVSGQETALIIESGNSWLINSNVIHPEAAYILSSLIDGRINRPAGAEIVIAGGKALVFAEYNTEVDIDIPWSGTTHVVRYNPIGEITVDIDSDLGGTFSAVMQRGELAILTSNLLTCCSGIRGNIDGDTNETINLLDVTYLINFLYKYGPEPDCIYEADVNGSGIDTINILDVTFLIAYLYRDGPAPVECP